MNDAQRFEVAARAWGKAYLDQLTTPDMLAELLRATTGLKGFVATQELQLRYLVISARELLVALDDVHTGKITSEAASKVLARTRDALEAWRSAAQTHLGEHGIRLYGIIGRYFAPGQGEAVPQTVYKNSEDERRRVDLIIESLEQEKESLEKRNDNNPIYDFHILQDAIIERIKRAHKQRAETIADLGKQHKIFIELPKPENIMRFRGYVENLLLLQYAQAHEELVLLEKELAKQNLQTSHRERINAIWRSLFESTLL